VTDPKSPCTDRVLVVGSGWLYSSGISHYTYRLSLALAGQYSVSTLLMRRLVPKRLYPGRKHVGKEVSSPVYRSDIAVYDGVDWYWGRSLRSALTFIDQQRPTVIILQWWTGAVLHTYLRLAKHASELGSRIVLEWHERQDVGEASLPGARQYVRMLMPRLLSLVDAHVVHSAYDLEAVKASYPLGDAPVHVIPHGPYDHLVDLAIKKPASESGPFQILYFGVVRPFKGVEDLVAAFDSLEPDQAHRFRLLIVGETWEGWTAPDRAIEQSRYAHLIERVDRYVTDRELSEYVRCADGVVLPYHRSSSSGPLQLVMSAGLPVVVTAVGGLVEAVRDYQGALLVPAQDVAALGTALLQLAERRGERYEDSHSWQRTVSSYQSMIEMLNQADRKAGQRGHTYRAAVGADGP